jgi:SAM-dependent methyltransferase
MALGRRISQATLLAVHQPWQGVDEEIHRRLARLADPREGQEVLWVGCGTGRSPLWWAARYQAHVHAVDQDAEAIEQAERSAREAGLSDRVIFQAADPGNLPHEDRTFDLVVLNALYGGAARAPAVIREAARVARPLAVVVAVVPTWLRPPPEHDARRLAQLGVLPYQMVEWKQFFRDAGLVELAVEDAAADGAWLAQGVGVVGRAWRAARWAGVSAVLSAPAAALRRLSRSRVLGLGIVKGTRWPHE